MSSKTTIVLASAIFCLGVGLFAFTRGAFDAHEHDPATGSTQRSAGTKRPGSRKAPPGGSVVTQNAWKYFRESYDGNGDGRVTRAEYPRGETAFARLDADADGAVTLADLVEREQANWAEEMEEYVVAEGGPHVGQPAPEFQLTSTDGEEFDLARYRRSKPVVLIFGSFT